MSFLPDPEQLYAIADRIGAHAATTRARAAKLAALVAGAGWRGLAADAFTAEALGVVAALRAAAGRLDDAADAMRRHAADIRRLLDDVSLLGAGSLQALRHAITDPSALVSDGKRIFDAGKSLLGDALSMVGI